MVIGILYSYNTTLGEIMFPVNTAAGFIHARPDAGRGRQTSTGSFQTHFCFLHYRPSNRNTEPSDLIIFLFYFLWACYLKQPSSTPSQSVSNNSGKCACFPLVTLVPLSPWGLEVTFLKAAASHWRQGVPPLWLPPPGCPPGVGRNSSLLPITGRRWGTRAVLSWTEAAPLHTHC